MTAADLKGIQGGQIKFALLFQQRQVLQDVNVFSPSVCTDFLRASVLILCSVLKICVLLVNYVLSDKQMRGLSFWQQKIHTRIRSTAHSHMHPFGPFSCSAVPFISPSLGPRAASVFHIWNRERTVTTEGRSTVRKKCDTGLLPVCHIRQKHRGQKGEGKSRGKSIQSNRQKQTKCISRGNLFVISKAHALNSLCLDSWLHLLTHLH